jgi:hypothetical protein
MVVNRLSIDDTRVYDADGAMAICEPRWDAIERAIRQLDGKFRTQIILWRTESEFMVVGGGNNGMYSCGLVDQSGADFVIIDERRDKGGHVVVPCGQPTAISNEEVIDLAAVLLAANEYAESGQRCDQVKWKGPR